MKILLALCVVFLSVGQTATATCDGPTFQTLPQCQEAGCPEGEVCYKPMWKGYYRCCDCFPALAKVSLKNGKLVTMSELQIGNQVESVASDGSIIYSEVKGFLHKLPTVNNFYKSITTSKNDTINLSGKHLIYARKNHAEKFSPMYADQVQVGNEVLVPKNKELIPTDVKHVAYSHMQGVYVPLTVEGNIMIDGILASCYAVVDHDLGQIVMKPVQQYSDIMELVFGNENGVSAYVSVAQNLGRWVLPEYSKLNF